MACNYIDDGGTIDLASAFIEQNYDCLDHQSRKKLRSDQMKVFGRRPVLTQKETVACKLNFNNEERYYLNRIAFYLFKTWGANLRFEKFVAELKTLQTGTYPKRLELWFKLMHEHEEKLVSKMQPENPTVDAGMNLDDSYITKQNFADMIRASFLQNSSAVYSSFEEVVNRAFGTGVDTVKSISELMDICQTDPVVASLCKEVLQVSNERSTRPTAARM